MLGVTVGVTGKNFRKLWSIKIAKKYRKTAILSDSTVLFGGDKRDRTADLLNAIQQKSVDITSFFGCLGVTGGSQENSKKMKNHPKLRCPTCIQEEKLGVIDTINCLLFSLMSRCQYGYNGRSFQTLSDQSISVCL